MIVLSQPRWWFKDAPRPWHWPLLCTLSALYQTGCKLRRAFAKTHDLGPRTTLVGNAVAGGSGKTPTLLAFAALLDNDVVFVTRGYGGRIKQPTLVAPSHGAQDVGDEALLLARVAPTIVARDRVAGVKLAREMFADSLILLDDGLQNPNFRAARNVLVWDEFGAGNGHVLPCGPLRAPLPDTLARVDAVICIGDATAPKTPAFAAKGVVPPAETATPVMAFAGIGRPEKFYQSLVRAGYDLEAFYPFPDHHEYTEGELEALNAHGLPMVTTEKDWVRLPSSMQALIRPIPYKLAFEDEAAVKAWLSA